MPGSLDNSSISCSTAPAMRSTFRFRSLVGTMEGGSEWLRCKARDDDRARRTAKYAAASIEERNAADGPFSTPEEFGQRRGVHVAARQYHPHPLQIVRQQSLQRSRGAQHSGGLDEDLHPREEETHGVDEGLVRNPDHRFGELHE